MHRPRSRAVLLGTLLTFGACARKPATAANPTVAQGQRLYATYCATCHGPTGNGYAADNSPSLRTTTFLATATDAFLDAAITRGRPGTAMAAFGRALGGPLPPADVTAIVAFLRDGAPPLVQFPSAPVAGDPKAGETVYTNVCARCHGTKTQRSSAVHLANPDPPSDGFGRLPSLRRRFGPTAHHDDSFDDRAHAQSRLTTWSPTSAPWPRPPASRRCPRRLRYPARRPRHGPGPVVLNPRGRAPDFTLKDNLYVSIDDVKKALDAKRRLVIADARPPSDWLNLHITGAISTPYYDTKSLDDIPNDGTWVLAYCACPHHVSGIVVEELRRRGYKHTAVIDEGIFAWQQKKYPVVAAPGLAQPAWPPAPPAPPAAVAPSPSPSAPNPPRPRPPRSRTSPRSTDGHIPTAISPVRTVVPSSLDRNGSSTENFDPFPS